MSLFKGKRNDEGNSATSQNGLVYSQVFTGQAFLTPLIFNPTRAQIIEYKNLPSTVPVDEPNYVAEQIMDRETGEVKLVRRIVLLCKFDPNTQVEKGKGEVIKYGTNYYYNMSVARISSTIIFSRNKNEDNKPLAKDGKILVIDGKLNSAWVPCDVDKAIELNDNAKTARKSKDSDEIEDTRNEVIKFVKKIVKMAAASLGDVGYGASAIDLDTARMCRDGEEPFAKLIFDMTPLSSVRYMTKSDTKTMMKADPKKCEARQKDYEDFDFSHIEGIFNLLLDNQIDTVNDLIFEENKDSFQSKGEQCKFGVFFGARIGSDGVTYQSHMSPYGKISFGQDYTFKKAWETIKREKNQ